MDFEGSASPDYSAELLAQDLASYYGMIGDAANATKWLRSAFELSPSGVDTRILGSALFDPVRDAPQFAEAVDDVRIAARARVLDLRTSLSGPL